MPRSRKISASRAPYSSNLWSSPAAACASWLTWSTTSALPVYATAPATRGPHERHEPGLRRSPGSIHEAGEPGVAAPEDRHRPLRAVDAEHLPHLAPARTAYERVRDRQLERRLGAVHATHVNPHRPILPGVSAGREPILWYIFIYSIELHDLDSSRGANMHNTRGAWTRLALLVGLFALALTLLPAGQPRTHSSSAAPAAPAPPPPRQIGRTSWS